jgi:hypothetical protein
VIEPPRIRTIEGIRLATLAKHLKANSLWYAHARAAPFGMMLADFLLFTEN